MEGYQNPYHHQMQHQQQQMVGGGAGLTVVLDAGDRFPQWSAQETKEFLAIRAELDRSFMETKRNKLLWEAIAQRMKERGFSRSADQCKCKWKNLVTRYKGCETMEPEAVRQQFPFYNELHAIFSARMQRMLWAEAEAEAEGSASAAAAAGTPTTSAAAGRKRSAAAAAQISSEEEDSEGINVSTAAPVSRKKRKGKGGGGSVREVVEEWMRRQAAEEERWRESWEAREEERRRREEEWREAMAAMEKERLAMEKSWREREELRRSREEARAEKRDVLITALLNRLAGGGQRS